uniref:NADH-ubiquinone oxidoreductase chain 6 n=1 Tax=Howea angulata TaxID=2547848 RepID=A0A6H0N2F4_9CUCU|nr:NADH dehydrogenase subunit 6 [Howea angulata]
MSISILLIMWTLSMFFLFMKHPLSMGIILLLQTLMISLITGLMNYNFWFSYILFLIMVGGMLILFIYMTSVASNEKFKFSSKLAISSILILLTSLTLMMILDYYFSSMNFLNYDFVNQNSTAENNKSLIKFLNTPGSSNLTIIIIYLLITLIMVVKVTNINYGPLRQKF